MNAEIPRLLITGATGFIGCRLALHAHRAGIDAIATGRIEIPVEHTRAEELRRNGVRFQPGLLQDEGLVISLLRDRTAVIHLAAAQHESNMPESYFHTTNCNATERLLQLCAASGIKRFVYGSSIGVYGQSGREPLDESSALHPDNMYTRSKAAAERVVRAHHSSMQTCIARIGETYGPGDYRLLKLFRSVSRHRFVMIGTGENQRQCIHVQDLIRALLLAAQHPGAAGETFIFAGPRAITTQEMVACIADAIGVERPKRRVPMWPLLASARIMETILPPLHISAPLNTRRLDFFRKSLVFSTSKAQSLLGF
ncbi:MAG: NAD-dependent epimerase/dehydratase family protein, partial [Povalibacter sp.]